MADGWDVIVPFMYRDSAEAAAREIRNRWACRVEIAPSLTPSADLPACRDEDPAQPAILAACYPDPPEYQHPEEPDA